MSPPISHLKRVPCSVEVLFLALVLFLIVPCSKASVAEKTWQAKTCRNRTRSGVGLKSRQAFAALKCDNPNGGQKESEERPHALVSVSFPPLPIQNGPCLTLQLACADFLSPSSVERSAGAPCNRLGGKCLVFDL